MGRRAGLIAILACIAASGCGLVASPEPSASATSGSGTTAAASPQASGARDAAWLADLELLLPAMDHIHPALDHGTSMAALRGAVTGLESRIPSATDDEIMVGVLRIVGMVSAAGCDAHTGAYVWGSGTYPVDSLPLRLWLFGDDVVIVDALEPYRDLIGWRVDAVAGRPIGDVVAALDPIVPRDNAETVRLLLPRFLLTPQILRGLGLAGDGSIELRVTPPPGAVGAATSHDVTVDPIPMADYNAWAGPYGLHLPADPNVGYLARIDDVLWWERRPDGTLFVQYNRVDALPAGQLEGLRTALHGAGVRRVVLDLRHNYGGEVRELASIQRTFEDPAVDRPGRLFVITGRNTFSAGSLLASRLEASTSAIVVGEPMGGCPTAYGNARDVHLPWSGIVVGVASLLEVGVTVDDTRATIQPELPAELTLPDWLAGRDPALRAIDGFGP
jgi:hypothetical protein